MNKLKEDYSSGSKILMDMTESGKQKNPISEFVDATKKAKSSEETAKHMAEKALMTRPGLSIRTRLIIGFLVVFFITIGVCVAMWLVIFRLDAKLEFVERSDMFAIEIQQCRRYEKNYFLYGTGLKHLHNHLNNARKILTGAQTELGRIVGLDRFVQMQNNIEEYNKLIGNLLDARLKLKPGETVINPTIENDLRKRGSHLLDTALLISRQERDSIRQSFRFMIKFALIFLVIIFLVMLYLANFLTKHFLRRLTQLMVIVERIGKGDFTPIMPSRKYKDEFSDVAVAMNSMMYELGNRQEQLIQARKISAMGTLTAGIAHEINNPVNNVSLILESLVESGDTMDTEELHRLYQDGMEQCDRVSDIIKNLLEFSRASHTKVKQVSIEEIVNKTKRLVLNEMDLYRISFHKEVRDQLPDMLIDAGGVQQVLLNLFLNAIQAMPYGGDLTVSIGLSKTMNECRIDVIDTGKGIDQEYIDKIFDPFYTTKKNGEGTGLGLSVSYSIIEKNGGRIKVNSKPGQGTIFSIYLPLKRPDF